MDADLDCDKMWGAEGADLAEQAKKQPVQNQHYFKHEVI